MNGPAVYEALKYCDGIVEFCRNGALHCVVPAGTVHLKLRSGMLRPLNCNLTVTVRRRSERQRKLNELLSPERNYFFWTMHDFTWALKLPFNSRWCGEIGKDLKALGVYRGRKVNSRRKVYGLIDARTKKPMGHCVVFSVQPFDTRPTGIRKAYRAQAKERLAACREMRARL
jgi:hypothetical protein